MNIYTIMTAKFPEADLHQYCAHLEAATGRGNRHHIAPRKEFPELASKHTNIIVLSPHEHFVAHYLLAIAVPECISFQTAFYLMAKTSAASIRTDALPFFAEVYERGMLANAERTRKQNVDPVFAAVRDAGTRRAAKKRMADSAWSAACVQWGKDSMRKLRSEPGFTAANAVRSSVHMKKLHADPVFAAAHAERCRVRMLKRNADPVFAAASAERSRVRMLNPEFRARVTGARVAGRKYLRSFLAQGNHGLDASVIEKLRQLSA